MFLNRFLATGAAAVALGGAASAADPDTVRLGRSEPVAVVAATTPADDTELVHGRRGGFYGGYGYRGGYGGYGRSYYGGYGYGRGYYGGYSRPYYGGYGYYGRPYVGIGIGFGGGYYGGYSSGYYSYPSYYSAPAYYYGISGTDAPAVNLAPATAQPLVSPVEAFPTAAPVQKVQATESVKISGSAPRAAMRYPAYGEK